MKRNPMWRCYKRSNPLMRISRARILRTPKTVKNLNKVDLQALINARIKNGQSNRKVFDDKNENLPDSPPPKSPKIDRFNTKYLSPAGQRIQFMERAVNTP